MVEFSGAFEIEGDCGGVVVVVGDGDLPVVRFPLDVCNLRL